MCRNKIVYVFAKEEEKMQLIRGKRENYQFVTKICCYRHSKMLVYLFKGDLFSKAVKKLLIDSRAILERF